jgi:hypothetical protein
MCRIDANCSNLNVQIWPSDRRAPVHVWYVLAEPEPGISMCTRVATLTTQIHQLHDVDAVFELELEEFCGRIDIECPQRQ